ncbi:Ornithine carbamoyltransferase [Pirellula sp. SH-Sr6A]|uniref:ornithine carbamoyltransferase n=1 Tax=Pirellula sp. SH-Sr6A TaxID=1632865 RepID=UPI00078C7ED3|nr:ornithine carbamoyltransferase [Pirellula sp. SH-Sr6A]AMV31219.1 Ornithine carbamoyltransferase [Pirellula sp. SH-Sr6A]
MKHIRSLFDLTLDEFHQIIALAGELKHQLRTGDRVEHLKNRTLAMIFEKASLRTRVSFEAGMAQLGGTALYLTSDVGWRERESIADFVRVLAEYCDFIVCRAISQSTVDELASHNVLPVINGLTDHAHPCQALADYMTLRETIPEIEGKQITFVGDGNNVARSLLNVCSMGRIRFRLVGPKEYHIQSSYIEKVKEHAGWLDFEQGTDIDHYVRDADFLYTDVWTSMGQEAEAAVRNAAFRPYQINKTLMSKAPAHCKVLHCLPARRGQEISDDVIDSASSLVFPQAGNRMHVQKGLLVWLARMNGMIT